ncbi:MAG: IclR family transcriptional regulator [Streptosporangiaceae bacterium]
MATESSTSVQRAIAILEALGSPEGTQRRGLGVVDIARLVGREKSQVSRTLKLLAEAGLADRDPETLRYRLGWRLFTLAANAGEQRLRFVAPPILRRLVAAVKERAHLSVLAGGGVLTVLSESPSRAVQTAGWVGRVTPVYCTSSGRALLFDHADEDVRALLEGLDLSGGGPKAPRDVGDLLDRLRRARDRGYALVDEEFEPDLVAVAAPVRDARGRVVAALNVSAPKFRMSRGLAAVGRQVRAAADQLSRSLTTGQETGSGDHASARAARARGSVPIGRGPA